MNDVTPITNAVQQVANACNAGVALFSAAQEQPLTDGWMTLDPAKATEATIEMEAALQAVREVAQQIPEGVLLDLTQFLDRADNRLEYSLATICISAGDQAEAHAGRAGSAMRQLTELVSLSDYISKKIGSMVLSDTAAALRGSD